MLKCALLVIALVVSFPSVAALTYWESYDLKNCKHWGMTPNDIVGQGVEYTDALDLVDELNLRDQSNRWQVVEAGLLFENGRTLFGVCRISLVGTRETIQCAEGIDFPLSGATYEYVGTKVVLQTYKCIQGCNGTQIQMIHDMGYESDGVNIEYERIKKKFELKCHEEEKRRKYSEESNRKQEEENTKRRAKELYDSNHKRLFGY